MRGNTNSYSVLGSETKILNVVQTGTLTREGTVFSGFSLSNYLRCGARVDKGILSLDSSTYTKNFGLAASMADNWEMVWKIKTPNASVFYGPFIDQGGYIDDYFIFTIRPTDNQLYFRFVNGVNGKGTTVLQPNTVYYAKLVFTGSSYNGYLSTTGSFSGEETTEFEVPSMQKIINAGDWNIGHYDNTENLNSSLDLEKCYIKINGEYWWKGVEIPNKISSITDESAIDLLLQQNSAKEALANNLNGLGVTANAKTDSLNQLAYKVSTVISSSNRQGKESIGALIPITGGSDNQIGFQIKNGWVFVIPSHDNNDVLYYKKLSSFELYNYYESIPTNMQTKSNMNSEIWRNNYIKFSEDGNYLFTNNDTGINRWSVTWGSNYSTVSFSNKISITPTYEGNEDNIYDFDISGDGSKLIFQTNSYGTGIIDISSVSTSTTVAYIPLQNLSSNSEFQWRFTNVDNEIMRIARNDGTNKIEMRRYSVTNNTCTEESRFEVTCCNSLWWEVGFQIYKDLNNHYKIIYHNGGYNYDIPAFVIYDCSTKVFTQCFCYVNQYYSDSRSYPISVFVKDNKYYLMAGMCILIFDSNWNLLGNTLVKLDYENFSSEAIRNSVYWNGDMYAFSGDYYDNVIRYKMYFDKKLVYSRDVTPVGKSQKQLNYTAFPTEQDILDGYYD